MATSRTPIRKPPTGAYRRPTSGGQHPKTARTVRRGFRRPRSGGVPPWVWGAAGVVLVLVLSFGFKLMARSSDDSEVKGQMMELVRRVPSFKANAQYYQSLIERCHPAAFEAAYTIGGRHQSNHFNDTKYLLNLFERMARLAKEEGHGDFAAELDTIHDKIAAN